MAGIDEVLERLVGDAEFRKALAEDPRTALAGYDLSRDDLEVLSAQLDEGTGGEHAVEQRTSKSAMMGLITGILGAGEASGSQDGPANAESGPVVSGDDTHYDGKPIARYHLEQAWPKDQNPDEIAPPAPETESGDYSLWRNNFGTADQASGDTGGLSSAEAVPAAEDTAQQSGDPDQPVIIGSLFNGEAGSDASATDLADLAGSEEGSGQPEESDLDFITERAHESADGGWYTTPPTITVSGTDDSPADDPGTLGGDGADDVVVGAGRAGSGEGGDASATDLADHPERDGDYLSWELKNARVTSYSVSGATDAPGSEDMPDLAGGGTSEEQLTEEIAFNYSKVDGPDASDPDDPAGFIQVGEAPAFDAPGGDPGSWQKTDGLDGHGEPTSDAPGDVSGGEDAQQPMGPPQSAHVAISLGDTRAMEQDGAAGEGSEGSAGGGGGMAGGEGDSEDPAAAGGHEVEYEVEEGEK